MMLAKQLRIHLHVTALPSSLPLLDNNAATNDATSVASVAIGSRGEKKSDDGTMVVAMIPVLDRVFDLIMRLIT